MSNENGASRIKTREAALLFIYQSKFRAGSYLDVLKAFRENEEYDLILDNDFDYFKELTTGVLDHADELDKAFEPFLKGWRLERIATIDRIILEMAVYEISSIESVHTSVAINEAVKLAKKYSDSKSSSFINGVLSSYEKSL